MYVRVIKITNTFGIHVRMAAMIVSKVAEIKGNYGANLYLSKSKDASPLAISMLSLISLRIQYNDEVYISSDNTSENAIKAIDELYTFIKIKINVDESPMNKIDMIIEENNLTNEQIIENIPIGVIITDIKGNITTINSYALDFLCIKGDNLSGKYIKDIFTASKLLETLKDLKIVKGEIAHYNDQILIMNRAPIISGSNLIGAIEMFQDISKLINIYEEELNYYKDELFRHRGKHDIQYEIIGSSKKWLDCFSTASKASKSTSTVLIRGESGTGKELIAKYIHNNSNRKKGSFVRVNCAAIPENLLESELFGYEKGAFTGAIKSKPGKFLIADGGTIFLDEIGDMPKSMQVKLLRVLQEREVESIGSNEPIKVDIRVIAATNRPLEKMMEDGDFREDLYYRLNVIGITLPPLRDRKEDIPSLVDHLIHKTNKTLEKNITGMDKEALDALINYDWPGNIRELENVIERASNMCERNTITLLDLPEYINKFQNNNNHLINLRNNELCTFEAYEKEIIEKAMEKYKSYNKTGKVLGLTHRTISLKCQKYGIEIKNK